MNPRRRLKNLLPAQQDPTRRPHVPAPTGVSRKRVDKATGAAWLFADFLAAVMTLPPDQLADLE